MKFLSKISTSRILLENITYKENASANNSNLRTLLIDEQRNFCAYTEKYLESQDSVEVEHFNAALKYNDNYYNYYAVIRNANLYKPDEKYVGASFFNSLFFQNREVLTARIGFKNNIYYEISENDQEAADLINFLGLNHPALSLQRNRHIKRLKETFQKGGYSKEDIQNYFREYREQLSFSTAIDIELDIETDHIINN